MDQGSEAPTASLLLLFFFFLVVEAHRFLPGGPLTFDERCGQCLAGTRLCSCRAGSRVGVGQGSQDSCPQASAAQPASTAGVGSQGPVDPALLRVLCPQVPAGARARPL